VPMSRRVARWIGGGWSRWGGRWDIVAGARWVRRRYRRGLGGWAASRRLPRGRKPRWLLPRRSGNVGVGGAEVKRRCGCCGVAAMGREDRWPQRCDINHINSGGVLAGESSGTASSLTWAFGDYWASRPMGGPYQLIPLRT
jgi:hypothetical protein